MAVNLSKEAETWLGVYISKKQPNITISKIYSFIERYKTGLANFFYEEKADLSNYQLMEELTNNYIFQLCLGR